MRNPINRKHRDTMHLNNRERIRSTIRVCHVHVRLRPATDVMPQWRVYGYQSR